MYAFESQTTTGNDPTRVLILLVSSNSPLKPVAQIYKGGVSCRWNPNTGPLARPLVSSYQIRF